MDRARIMSLARYVRAIVIPGTIGTLLLGNAVLIGSEGGVVDAAWAERVVLIVGMGALALGKLLPSR